MGGSQTLQRLAWLVDGGVLGQRTRPGRERHLDVAPLRLLDPGYLGEQLEPSGDRVLDGEAQLEKLDDAIPGLGGPFDRLEDRDRGQPVVVAPRDRVERVAGPRVLRRPGQDAGVAADRPLDVAQLGLDEARRAERQLVARGGVLDPGGACVEHLDQIGLAPLGGQDPIEIGQRLAVARRLAQERAQLLDRPIRLAEVLFVDAGALHEEHAALVGAVGDLDLAGVDLAELAEGPGGEVELRQRFQRLRLVGIDLEDRLPGPHGALGLLERVFIEDRDPLGDHLALVAVDGDLQVAFEDLHQLARATRAGQQALERQEDLPLVGPGGERRAPRFDGLGGPAER